MKHRNNEKNIKKIKSIRKLLLIASDIEMQKKIKEKNYILINSKTPKQLENLFQLSKGPINISVSTYTNILEKHFVQKIVNIPKNINYYYSDIMDKKKKKENKIKEQKLQSTKDFIVDYDNLLENEESESENFNKKDIIGDLIPFYTKKKCVGHQKIREHISNSKFEIGKNHLFKIREVKNDNNNNENNDKNINNNIYDGNYLTEKIIHKCEEKHENTKKIKDINYKLVYYCYTYLKRKRPIYKVNSDISIYGLQLEEEVLLKRTQSNYIKKTKPKKEIKNLNIKYRSSKEINKRKSQKNKKKENPKIKEYKSKSKGKIFNNKIRPRKSTFYNKNSNVKNNNIEVTKKFVPNKNEKRQSLKTKRYTQIIRENLGIKSIEKKLKSIYNTNTSQKKKSSVIGRSPNPIISKADTKNTSFDYISSNDMYSPIKNKKKYTNFHLHPRKDSNYNDGNKKEKNNNKDMFEKNEKLLFRRNLKYTTQRELKHEYPDEMKIKEIIHNKKHKNTLVVPKRGKFLYPLQKYVDYEEKKLSKEKFKKFLKNKPSSKTALLSKMYSLQIKSQRSYRNLDDNSNDDFFFFRNRINSSKSKSKKKLESIKLKKMNSINKK